jgi:hypothetical protein
MLRRKKGLVKAICIVGIIALIATMMVMPVSAFEPCECEF